MIALARYYMYVQVNGAAELVAHARSTLVLNRLFNGRTKMLTKASTIANFFKLLLTSKKKVRRN